MQSGDNSYPYSVTQQATNPFNGRSKAIKKPKLKGNVNKNRQRLNTQHATVIRRIQFALSNLSGRLVTKNNQPDLSEWK